MTEIGWLMMLTRFTSRAAPGLSCKSAAHQDPTSATLARLLLAGVILVGLPLAGCSTEESLPQLDVESAATADEKRAGSLLAEYAHPRGEQSDGVSVHAQFLDVRGVNYETALEALEVWSPEWQLDVDACSLRANPLNSDSNRHSDSSADNEYAETSIPATSDSSCSTSGRSPYAVPTTRSAWKPDASQTCSAHFLA